MIDYDMVNPCASHSGGDEENCDVAARQGTLRATVLYTCYVSGESRHRP